MKKASRYANFLKWLGQGNGTTHYDEFFRLIGAGFLDPKNFKYFEDCDKLCRRMTVGYTRNGKKFEVTIEQV